MMTPIATFYDAWARCEHLTALHAYLARNLTAALVPEEVLRAEWVARVAALDLYVHELVAQRILEIFSGTRPPSQGFLRYQTSNDIFLKVLGSAASTDVYAALDLEVRGRLGFVSFQDPVKIADGVRFFSDIELWNEVAIFNGATQQNKQIEAKRIKRSLSLIVERRNKIAHEGDLQPGQPRVPWPIDVSDLVTVKQEIERVVKSIDALTS